MEICPTLEFQMATAFAISRLKKAGLLELLGIFSPRSSFELDGMVWNP
jgi:hypothetical protein